MKYPLFSRLLRSRALRTTSQLLMAPWRRTGAAVSGLPPPHTHAPHPSSENTLMLYGFTCLEFSRNSYINLKSEGRRDMASFVSVRPLSGRPQRGPGREVSTRGCRHVQVPLCGCGVCRPWSLSCAVLLGCFFSCFQQPGWATGAV